MSCGAAILSDGAAIFGSAGGGPLTWGEYITCSGDDTERAKAGNGGGTGFGADAIFSILGATGFGTGEELCGFATDGLGASVVLAAIRSLRGGRSLRLRQFTRQLPVQLAVFRCHSGE